MDDASLVSCCYCEAHNGGITCRTVCLVLMVRSMQLVLVLTGAGLYEMRLLTISLYSDQTDPGVRAA
jgi:hypothetical protein